MWVVTRDLQKINNLLEILINYTVMLWYKFPLIAAFVDLWVLIA